MSAHQLDLLRMVWKAKLIVEYELSSVDCDELLCLYHEGKVNASKWQDGGNTWVLFSPLCVRGRRAA